MSLDSGLESGLESGLDPDGNRRGPSMTAEAITHDTGPGEHTVLLPRISTDPLDDLVDRVRPMLGRAVDSLHVAAALEADGLTDRGARVEYGYHDVFALSAEVFRRLGPRSPMPRDAAALDPRSLRESLRLIGHGPLYVLPCTAFPAVLAIVGRRSLVLGLVFAGILGWVYAGVASHAAYRMLGFGRPRAAGRILIVATLTVPIVGAVTGAALVWLTGGGVALVAMITCQVAYQLTSTVMVFYRRELWLALVMTPAFLVGAAYLILGAELRPWSAAVAAGCVLAGFLLAVLVAVHRDRAAATAEPPLRAALRPEVPALFRVGAYGLCSAVLLLHAEAPYLLGSLDVAIAAAPLIITMGVIEWRAERFRPQVVALLHRVERPRVFVRGVWRLLAREGAICLLAPAIPAAAMLAGLYYLGLVSAAGIVMTGAHVALGGAYLLAFLLAGRDRFGWLCWSMVAAIGVHVGAGALLGSAPLLGISGSALVDTSVYLGSVLLLQALFVLGLVPILGQAAHYR